MNGRETYTIAFNNWQLRITQHHRQQHQHQRPNDRPTANTMHSTRHRSLHIRRLPVLGRRERTVRLPQQKGLRLYILNGPAMLCRQHNECIVMQCAFRLGPRSVRFSWCWWYGLHKTRATFANIILHICLHSYTDEDMLCFFVSLSLFIFCWCSCSHLNRCGRKWVQSIETLSLVLVVFVCADCNFLQCSMMEKPHRVRTDHERNDSIIRTPCTVSPEQNNIRMRSVCEIINRIDLADKDDNTVNSCSMCNNAFLLFLHRVKYRVFCGFSGSYFNGFDSRRFRTWWGVGNIVQKCVFEYALN